MLDTKVCGSSDQLKQALLTIIVGKIYKQTNLLKHLYILYVENKLQTLS